MKSADQALSVRVRLERGTHRPFVLDVAFEAPPGITALVGPSGCGKSSVLAAVSGIARPQRGRVALGQEVWFDAAEGIDRPPHRRSASLVFQSLALFPHMTAQANVAFGVPRNLPRSEREARAGAMLERMGVAHLADRRPASFSGGEAQRVALARAFAHAPRVLLLDEPLTALDVPLRARLAQDVRRFVDEAHLVAIYVTHDVGEAMTLADHAVTMVDGHLAASGSPLDVLPHGGVD
jgi:molybdate transport system ATP-binding protein